MTDKENGRHQKGNDHYRHSQAKSDIRSKQAGYSEFILTKLDGSTENIWLKGRNAWALHNLIAAGKSGCTPITHVGPRWSAYVFNLRKEIGLDIETKHEAHDGPFAGTHARYILHSNILEVLESESA